MRELCLKGLRPKKIKIDDECQHGYLGSKLLAVLSEQQEITSWELEHLFTVGQESAFAQ